MSSSFQPSARKKTPRIYISTEKQGIIEPLNSLLIKIGQPPRNPDKIQIALENSLVCLSAKSFQDKSMIGFVRATGDGVFHISVWDLIVDPNFPNQMGAKKLLLERLKREIKRIRPQCVVSLLAKPEDTELLSEMNFVEDYKGILPMTLHNH